MSGFCILENLGLLVACRWGYYGEGRTSFYDLNDFKKISDISDKNSGTTSIKLNKK